MDGEKSDASSDEILKQQIAEHGEIFQHELVLTQARFEERVRELSAVRRIVDALKYLQEPRLVFEGIIDAVIDETNAENCSLMILDRDTGELLVKAARSQTDTESRYYEPENLPVSRFRRGEGIAGWVAENGEPVSISDISQDTRFVNTAQSIGPIGSILCLPLHLDNHIVGVINLSHPHPSMFNDEDVRLMMLIADQVAIALNSVQLFEDTHKLNTILTREIDQKTRALQEANRDLHSEMAERKQAEKELVRTQRLRAVGELAAGVSHNLNNILTGIWGPAQILLRSTRDPHLVRQAELINTFAERAADLVVRLHQTTRVEEGIALQMVRVNDIVREAIETTRPRWKDEPESRNIANEISTHFHDSPTILGSASDLYDALVNLIFNAVDAMPQGGLISLATQIRDGQAIITVTDTGTGMDADTLQRIFEPFFTTKVDVGRGLGLFTVYNTITRWKGQLSAQSVPGQGTTFVISLPISEEHPTETDPPVLSPGGRRARILLVDDEPAIGEILFSVFHRSHAVEVFESGTDALARCQTESFDLAILDLGMPGMSGDVLALELRKLFPTLGLILTTGWKLPENDPRLEPFDFSIQKPFRGFDGIRDLVNQTIALCDQRKP
ncbi:MAG: GAF domain-containing protein [bacterium]|nr:GAF domain-containing protein [bacterium]